MYYASCVPLFVFEFLVSVSPAVHCAMVNSRCSRGFPATCQSTLPGEAQTQTEANFTHSRGRTTSHPWNRGHKLCFQLFNLNIHVRFESKCKLESFISTVFLI